MVHTLPSQLLDAFILNRGIETLQDFSKVHLLHNRAKLSLCSKYAVKLVMIAWGYHYLSLIIRAYAKCIRHHVPFLQPKLHLA